MPRRIRIEPQTVFLVRRLEPSQELFLFNESADPKLQILIETLHLFC